MARKRRAHLGASNYDHAMEAQDDAIITKEYADEARAEIERGRCKKAFNKVLHSWFRMGSLQAHLDSSESGVKDLRKINSAVAGARTAFQRACMRKG